MRTPPWSNRRPLPSLLLVAAIITIAACAGAAASPGAQSPPQPLRATARNVSGWVGDTASFKPRITGIGYAPDRVTYETPKPAYVTIVGVNDTRIEAIMPLVGEEPRIEMGGTHTAGLNADLRNQNAVAKRFGPGAAATVGENDARLAEIQAYNRCIANAEAADKRRREARPKVIGRDSAGRPIYGPSEPVAGEYTSTSQCRIGLASSHVTAPSMDPVARAGRFLFLYLSDTPVRHEEILALAITETEPQLMAISIGRKLFGPRGAIWSGQYRSW